MSDIELLGGVYKKDSSGNIQFSYAINFTQKSTVCLKIRGRDLLKMKLNKYEVVENKLWKNIVWCTKNIAFTLSWHCLSKERKNPKLLLNNRDNPDENRNYV